METIHRNIYCPHCDDMKTHQIVLKQTVIADGKVFVAFYKRCEKFERHALQAKPRGDGYRLDAIPAHDWNALVNNRFL